MKKLVLCLLSFVMMIPFVKVDTYSLENERSKRYDRWHYRYENAKGSYSHGETHPTSIDLPERYDSRDYDYVSSIKNQGMMGICWSFGAIGAMEVNINKNGLSDLGSQIDLSEAHLGYFHMAQKANDLGLNPTDAVIPDSDYTFINDGDSSVLASLTLAKGIGPVSESVAPFYPYSYSFVDEIPRDSIYQREYTLNTAVHPMADDIEGIKKLIYTQGAASIAYNSGSSDRYDEYVNRYGLSNHMIHIIGYDDTIPKEYFDPVPSIDGAWIVKNSWGDTPNGGIFYLSYAATSLEVMAPNMVHKDAYDNNYFYQASFMMDTEYTKVGEPIVVANVFEGQSGTDAQKEVLHSVGLPLASMNTEYELQIYLDPQEGNPESGKPVFDKPLMGSKTQKGYYTISLPESVEIKKGQKFSVVFRLQNRNLNYYTPYYVFKGGEFSTFDVVEETHPNQSFIKKANENWTDLHYSQKCVSIHALTNIVDKDYKPTKQLKLSDFSLTQTDYDFNNECIEPILTKNNKELLEMVDYSIAYENNIQLGTGKVIVFGMNDYEGSKVEYSFNINRADLKQEFFETLDFEYQTGSQIKPAFEMYDYDLLLVEGKDYVVEYGENIYDINTKNEGTVTLRGIGNYKGSVTQTFDIVNPHKKVYMSADVYPRDAGNASTKSEAHYGELVKAVAGYFSSGTAVLRWIVDGIDFGRGEEIYFTAYDSMNLTAYFVQEKTFNDLLNLYNECRLVQRNGQSDVRWNHFVKELDNARVLVDSASDYEKEITRVYVYLQDAYNMLNEPLDLSGALEALESIKGLNESDYEYRSWGTLQSKRVLLEKAIEDVNMTQDKLDNAVSAFYSAKDSLTGNGSNTKQLLKDLYESKLLLDEELYTVSSYALLKEKLDEVKVILESDASESQLSKAYNELNQITLVLRGNADQLINLVETCLLVQDKDYSTDSYNLLQSALQQALLIKNNPNDYSQKEIDSIYQELNDAYENLEPVPQVDKQQLSQLYHLHSNKNEENYTKQSWDLFKQALDEAFDILENNDVTQEDVDQAYNRLNQYAGLLEEKPVTPDIIEIESITLDINEIELEVGQTKQLTVTILPDNATDKTVTYQSDNEDVVKVIDGIISAVSPGKAKITVTTNNGKTATCYVIVNKPEEPEPPVEVKNGWEKVDDKWYYFIEDVAQTGWVKDGAKWYFMDDSGIMQTGWIKDNNKWYYLNSHMMTGWQKIDGLWYYLNTHMITGWLNDGGQWYFLDSAMKTGWIKDNGKWYYLDSAMKTGWQFIDGEWWYLNSHMMTGWQKINGTWYYLNNSMVTGWLKINNIWYYFNEKGAMVTGVYVIGGKTYYFDNNGAWLS